MKNFWLFVKAEQDQPFNFKPIAGTKLESGVITDAMSPIRGRLYSIVIKALLIVFL